jgi:hypothetical protein
MVSQNIEKKNKAEKITPLNLNDFDEKPITVAKKTSLCPKPPLIIHPPKSSAITVTTSEISSRYGSNNKKTLSPIADFICSETKNKNESIFIAKELQELMQLKLHEFSNKK